MSASIARRVPNADADVVRRIRYRRLAVAIVAIVIAADQLTKAWALSSLEGHPVSVAGHDVELRLARNSGGAFSVLRDFTPLLALMAIALTVILVQVLRRADDQRLVASLALVLGGAIGNLLDRFARAPGLLRGEVVDFVKIGAWPTFNLADSAVTIGVIVLIVELAFPRRRADESPQ
jgi:signal peptidase II